MGKLALSIALGEYDHTRDLVSGVVPIEGVEPRFLKLSIEAITNRFMAYREFDVCELSFGNYCALLRNADPPAIALPVFTSRVFRHSAVYVRGDSALWSLDQLAGKTVGIPQWSQTATIYVRGLLASLGVNLSGISWIQAGVVEPGRVETASFSLPSGLRLTAVADRTLTEMLLGGELDAVISARPPDGLGDGPLQLRHLLRSPRDDEAMFWEATGIFPIMHLIVLRRDVYERDRWIANSLFDAFQQAKRRSVQRLNDLKASYLPVAWGRDQVKASHEKLFGPGEPWPYGLTGNRRTIDGFLSYCQSQGIVDRLLSAEELFAPETLGETRV